MLSAKGRRAGEIATITNPRQETTTYAYDGNGFLQSVTGAMTGATTTYGYDGYGRLLEWLRLDGERKAAETLVFSDEAARRSRTSTTPG
jgi:YD repeat-containing protein